MSKQRRNNLSIGCCHGNREDLGSYSEGDDGAKKATPFSMRYVKWSQAHKKFLEELKKAFKNQSLRKNQKKK